MLPSNALVLPITLATSGDEMSLYLMFLLSSGGLGRWGQRLKVTRGVHMRMYSLISDRVLEDAWSVALQSDVVSDQIHSVVYDIITDTHHSQTHTHTHSLSLTSVQSCLSCPLSLDSVSDSFSPGNLHGMGTPTWNGIWPSIVY